MLELINVSKQYDTVTALAPLDLVLEAETTYVLLGTSGCGKSTLLKVALGLVETDTGSVRLGGQQLTEQNAERLRQRIGYVIQDGGLFPHLTARDNVSLLARYLGWNRERIEARLAELAELTQLLEERDLETLRHTYQTLLSRIIEPGDDIRRARQLIERYFTETSTLG